MELALDVLLRWQMRNCPVVSILVFVELALDEPGTPKTFTQEEVFQSLFSWNLLLMCLALGHSGSSGYVSILVFVELALDGGNPGHIVDRL